MYIASQKRKTNVAEYLLYMWQVEDMIRANQLDIDKLEKNVIDKFELTPEQKLEMTRWYESLIDMMRREDVKENGHLQINKNVMGQLEELHKTLLADSRFPEYSAEFYRTLPYIVELRAKAGVSPAPEIETCFNALYGILLMGVQGKNVSEDTRKAMSQISKLVALLAAYFKLNDEDRLFNDDGSVGNPLKKVPQPDEKSAVCQPQKKS